MLATPAIAAELQPVRSITVNGIAQRKVVPDEAHLNVNLNAFEPKLADAKSSQDAKLKKLMGIVKSAGIDEKKISTQSANIQPIYDSKKVLQNGNDLPACVRDHRCPEPETKSIRVLTGYRAQLAVDITVGDVAKLGGLMDNVAKADLEKGATEDWGPLISVYYSLSNPEKIRDEMLTDALRNAKEKASKMAVAAGSNIARVYQIQESGSPNFYFPRPMMMRESMAINALVPALPKAEMAPPAGEQEVSASVTVMYELKD